MGKIRAPFRVMKVQLIKNLSNARIAVLCILMGLFFFSYLQPIGDFARDVGYSVTPYGFVFMANDMISQMIIMAGVIALFCDAPFRDTSFPFLITRAGTSSWVAGNLLYILAVSALYILFLLLMSIVPLFPTLDWQLGWGKIWGTLARTDAGWDYNIALDINDIVRAQYAPMAALIRACLFEWMCVSLLGMIVYLGNLVSKKQVGLWMAAFFVFFDITIYNMMPAYYNKVSPVSLAKLTMQNGRFGMTPTYATCFFIAAIGLLILLCYFAEKITFRHKERKRSTLCITPSSK